MQEIMVRVFRAIACRTRLRLLARLAAAGELMPSQLARELRIGRDLVCAHAARLAGVGLIKRRRSGSRCYCVAESPYSPRTLSGQLCAWLREVLSVSNPGAPAPTRHGSRGARASHDTPDVRETVFKAATAFANLRRLKILRFLADGRTADAQTLMRELKMSRPAVSRQIAKLVRRGYIRAVAGARRVQYQLVRGGNGPLHARLLEIVGEHWD